MTKSSHGGKRNGAGRPSSGKTISKVIRLPIALFSLVESIIDYYKKGGDIDKIKQFVTTNQVRVTDNQDSVTGNQVSVTTYQDVLAENVLLKKKIHDKKTLINPVLAKKPRGPIGRIIVGAEIERIRGKPASDKVRSRLVKLAVEALGIEMTTKSIRYESEETKKRVVEWIEANDK